MPNTKRVIAALVALLAILIFNLIVTGCSIFGRYVHINDRFPVYDLPVKAQIAKLTAVDLDPLEPEVRADVLRTVRELKGEASALRATLRSYNSYARGYNDAYRDKYGIKRKEDK